MRIKLTNIPLVLLICMPSIGLYASGCTNNNIISQVPTRDDSVAGNNTTICNANSPDADLHACIENALKTQNAAYLWPILSMDKESDKLATSMPNKNTEACKHDIYRIVSLSSQFSNIIRELKTCGVIFDKISKYKITTTPKLYQFIGSGYIEIFTDGKNIITIYLPGRRTEAKGIAITGEMAVTTMTPEEQDKVYIWGLDGCKIGTAEYAEISSILNKRYTNLLWWIKTKLPYPSKTEVAISPITIVLPLKCDTNDEKCILVNNWDGMPTNAYLMENSKKQNEYLGRINIAEDVLGTIVKKDINISLEILSANNNKYDWGDRIDVRLGIDENNKWEYHNVTFIRNNISTLEYRMPFITIFSIIGGNMPSDSSICVRFEDGRYVNMELRKNAN